MNFLFLDCTFNINSGSKNWDDYFSTSLLDQYSNIHKKNGNTQKATIDDFKNFMNVCFNSLKTNTYYFSMPAFDREPELDKKLDKTQTCVIIP